MNEINPDYVVVGESRSYSYEKIERAIRLVRNGAKLIGANPDLTDKLGKHFAYHPRYVLSGVGDIPG